MLTSTYKGLDRLSLSLDNSDNFYLETYNKFDGLTDECIAKVNNECHRPLIKAMHRNTSFTLFLDSGSPYNLISEDVYKKYFSHIPISNNVSLGLCDIQGHPINTLGKLILPFKIADLDFETQIFIVKNIVTIGEVLLGFSFLTDNHIVLEPGKNRIRIGNLTEQFIKNVKGNIGKSFYCEETNRLDTTKSRKKGSLKINHKDDNCSSNILENNQEVTISNRHNFQMNPQQSLVIKCKINPVYNRKHMITLSETGRIKGITITPSLGEIKNNSIYIEIKNERGTVIDVRKGTLICNVETYSHPIEIIDNPSQETSGIIAQLQETRENELGKRENYYYYY